MPTSSPPLSPTLSDEFEIIAAHFRPLSDGAAGALGLTDDAALLTPPVGYEHVITMDTVVVSVHVPEDAKPAVIADKLMGSNLSDLAAMGARPVGCTLSCAWGPHANQTSIKAFAAALSRWTDNYGFPLLGGDTVRTPDTEVFTLTAIGEVRAGRALRRNGAKVGDGVFVSGSIGDGALGLAAIRQELPGLSDRQRAFLCNRYTTPQPRIALGLQLSGQAHACIDISDGLIQDLYHIAEQSNVRIDIAQADIPLSSAARAAVDHNPALWSRIFAGGDDYELAFTAEAAPKDPATPVTRIGTVTNDGPAGVVVRDEQGNEISLEHSGFSHF